MATPINTPIIQPTDFDQFLDELGLGILSQEERDDLAKQAREMATYAVIVKIRQAVGTDKIKEFTELMERAYETGDHTEFNQFFQRAVPNPDFLIEEAVEEVKKTIRAALRNMPKMMEKYMNLYDERVDEKRKRQQAEDAVETEEQKDTEEKQATETESFKGADPFPWEIESNNAAEEALDKVRAAKIVEADLAEDLTAANQPENNDQPESETPAEQQAAASSPTGEDAAAQAPVFPWEMPESTPTAPDNEAASVPAEPSTPTAPTSDRAPLESAPAPLAPSAPDSASNSSLPDLPLPPAEPQPINPPSEQDDTDTNSGTAINDDLDALTK